MKKSFRMTVVAGVIGVVACTADSTDTRVARAHTFEFTADDAVQLVGPQVGLPNDPAVIQTVADIWIDYTLLAWAINEDSTLAQLDLVPLIKQQVDQEMILALRDSVIQPDTAVTEEELRDLFANESPGVQLRARHLLLGVPPQATEAQRDSVRQRAADLRARIARGEDFATLASQFSQDRGSGQQGGDLGYFERGFMVRPFDEAVFALSVGELSDVVETPYGYHVIRLEERVIPTFDDSRVEYRQRLQTLRLQAAESTYIAGVMDAADSEIQTGAAEVVREVARSPRANLSRRAASRRLVTYSGGSVTVEDLRDFMETRDASYRVDVIEADDQAIENGVLEALLQRQLLARAAVDLGLSVPEARQDSLTDVARLRFVDAARTLGLTGIAPQDGESRQEAVQAAVTSLMQAVVSNQTNVLPLGPIALTLRKQFRNEIFEAGIISTVARINEIRGPAAAPQAGTVPAAAPAPVPDSAGG